MGSGKIVCPYCGKENKVDDLFEYDGGRHEIECEYCGEWFTFYLEIYTSYDLTDVRKRGDE